MRSTVVPATAIMAVSLLPACSGGEPAGPEAEAPLEFSVALLDLGVERSATFELENTGGRAVGP
ncbi:MAG TPA: hypothetical protein VE173_13080, partial [Longimicrobiales bacterium]|nr:hypothetical protein [Longimicrobiales bacterium]